MSSYRGTADRPERVKAIAAVIAVHAALAFVILSGLNVQMVQHAVDRLTTIDIRQPPPPPPVQPPPQPSPKPQAMKKPQGAEAKKAAPSPVVAPQPKIPAPSPLPAAKVAGTGSAINSGAGLAGNGTGAGGAGTGPGGGGDYSGFTPARLITKIPDREYRYLRAASGQQSGRIGVTIRVNSDGTVSNCRIAQSSGSAIADALMCQLTARYIRFEPALDRSRRAIAQDVTFFPNWHP